MMMRASRPARACAASRSMSSHSRPRTAPARQERVVVRLARVARQVVEHVRHVFHDGRPRRDEPDVRVHARGRRVVVPGADMRVAADAVGLLAHDEAQLRMRLQVDEAVDDVDARFLQPVGPGDVVPLVEARLQLHEHGDLLARVRRLYQEIDERRIVADPVERHLDRDDGGIAERRAEQRLDRGERVERMMDHVVAVADELEHFLRLGAAPDHARDERRVFELGRCSLVSSIQSPKPRRSAVGTSTPSSMSKFSTRMSTTRLGIRSSTCSMDSAPCRSGEVPDRRSRGGRRPRPPGSPCRCRGRRGKGARPSPACPGNRDWTLPQTTSSRNANVAGAMPSRSGTPMNRGTIGGSLTRANFVRPSCFTATARFLLRFEMCGNGWPGSNASGVSTGAICARK